MNLTFKQYRSIDLAIMAVLLAVSEAVATMAAKSFTDQMFSVSTTIAIVCIVMMRWSGYAVIHAAVGGCVYCLVLGAPATQFAIYCAGNCGAIAALVLFKIWGKKNVAAKAWRSILFVLTAYCGAQIGRWAMSLILNAGAESPIGAGELLLVFLTRDIVTLLFTLLAVLISRRLDGIFEDQRAYLLRVDEEKRREKELRDREENSYFNSYDPDNDSDDEADL